MRLDKYLKVARIVKRRSVAKELALKGRILVNDSPAKAGHQIKISDKICLIYQQKELVIQVLALSEQVKKEDAYQLYRIISHRNLKVDGNEE